jgi:hypothetical protein
VARGTTKTKPGEKPGEPGSEPGDEHAALAGSGPAPQAQPAPAEAADAAVEGDAQPAAATEADVAEAIAAATPPPAAPGGRARYRVLSPLNHDNTDYAPGAELELDERHAAPLLAVWPAAVVERVGAEA